MNSGQYRAVRSDGGGTEMTSSVNGEYNTGTGYGAPSSTDRFQQTRREVDQVVDVMRDNVNKVLERDVKLGELDARAENLEAASNSFATSAKRVRKKMWWENLKMKLIIGGVVLAILIIIITIIVVKTSGGGGGGSSGGGMTTVAPEPEVGGGGAVDGGATG